MGMKLSLIQQVTDNCIPILHRAQHNKLCTIIAIKPQAVPALIRCTVHVQVFYNYNSDQYIFNVKLPQL